MSCRDEAHATSCGHHHAHGEQCDHDVEDPDGQSLFGVIDTQKLRCLNERVAGSCVNPFKPYAKRRELEPTLESNEDDPELLLYVPFTHVVKLKSICIVGGHHGEGTSPSKIKLNAQDLPAVQELELVENNFNAVVDYPLKLSKFQSVSTLTIVVTENYGGDWTSISYIGFKGENTFVRYGVVECVYEAAPTAADRNKLKGEEKFVPNSIS